MPQNIDVDAMPPVLAEKMPQGRSPSFFVKDDDNAIVLVSASEHCVADVIR